MPVLHGSGQSEDRQLLLRDRPGLQSGRRARRACAAERVHRERRAVAGEDQLLRALHDEVRLLSAGRWHLGLPRAPNGGRDAERAQPFALQRRAVHRAGAARARSTGAQARRGAGLELEGHSPGVETTVVGVEARGLEGARDFKATLLVGRFPVVRCGHELVGALELLRCLQELLREFHVRKLQNDRVGAGAQLRPRRSFRFEQPRQEDELVLQVARLDAPAGVGHGQDPERLLRDDEQREPRHLWVRREDAAGKVESTHRPVVAPELEPLGVRHSLREPPARIVRQVGESHRSAAAHQRRDQTECRR